MAYCSSLVSQWGWPGGELCGRRTLLTSDILPPSSTFKVIPSPTLSPARSFPHPNAPIPAFSHCSELLSICRCIDCFAFFVVISTQIIKRDQPLMKKRYLQVILALNPGFCCIDLK